MRYIDPRIVVLALSAIGIGAVTFLEGPATLIGCLVGAQLGTCYSFVAHKP